MANIDEELRAQNALRDLGYALPDRASRPLRIRGVRYRWRAIARWARVAIVAGVLAAFFVGAAVVGLVRYQPADAHFETFGPVAPSGAGRCTTPNLSDVNVCTVRTGDEFFIEGSIVNHSPIGVDLVGMPRGDYAMLEPVVVRGEPCNRSVLVSIECPVQHFPIHVAAHHASLLVIAYRIVARCVNPTAAQATTTGFGDPAIDLRVHFVGGDRVIHATFPGGRDRTLFRFDRCAGDEAVKESQSSVPR